MSRIQIMLGKQAASLTQRTGEGDSVEAESLFQAKPAACVSKDTSRAEHDCHSAVRWEKL